MVDNALARCFGQVHCVESTHAQGRTRMGDAREMAAAFEAVLKTGDFAKLGALIQDWATDDFVEEWPQSGERLTKSASQRMGEMYQEKSGTSPKVTYNALPGGAATFV